MCANNCTCSFSIDTTSPCRSLRKDSASPPPHTHTYTHSVRLVQVVGCIRLFALLKLCQSRCSNTFGFCHEQCWEHVYDQPRYYPLTHPPTHTHTHTRTHTYTHAQTQTHTHVRTHTHTHTGTPCVFYDHLKTESNGLRKAILELMAVRKSYGINVRCESSPL